MQDFPGAVTLVGLVCFGTKVHSHKSQFRKVFGIAETMICVCKSCDSETRLLVPDAGEFPTNDGVGEK